MCPLAKCDAALSTQWPVRNTMSTVELVIFFFPGRHWCFPKEGSSLTRGSSLMLTVPTDLLNEAMCSCYFSRIFFFFASLRLVPGFSADGSHN